MILIINTLITVWNELNGCPFPPQPPVPIPPRLILLPPNFFDFPSIHDWPLLNAPAFLILFCLKTAYFPRKLFHFRRKL